MATNTAPVKFGNSYRYLEIKNPSPEDIELLNLGSLKAVPSISNLKTWRADDKWVWDGVLEIIDPNDLSSSKGPTLSLVLRSSGEVTYHFSYWARPLHRAETRAEFHITPDQDPGTILFRIPWLYSTPGHCPNRYCTHEGTAGYGANEFGLASRWYFNLQNADYWPDCKPGVAWETARLLTNS
jgi:hypothetical protein